MSQKKLKRLKKLEKESSGVEVEKKIEVKSVRKIFRENWIFLLLLGLGVIGIYFNAMAADFVSDDYATIPQNPNIMSLKSTLGPAFFINLVKTSTALVFGIKSPVAFHIVNLVLYLLVCVVAFVFLNLFFSELVSRVALVIFAVLPVHVEAVSWISGIPYLISSLLILLELIFFVYFLWTRKKRYLFWLFLFTLVSIFSDRVRWLGFVLLAGLTLVSFKEKLNIRVNLGKIFGILISLFVLLFVITFPLMKARIASVNSGVNASDSIFYNPFFQYPTAMPKYLQLILIPIDLTLYHTMYVIPVWLNWIIFLTYLSALIWFFIKDKKVFFALAFIFLATASSMAPVKVSWLVAERYIFLGSLGVALLLAIWVEKFWKRKFLMIIVLSLLVGVYSTRVFLRNIDWQTNHNLWVNTCQVSPNSHNAWNNIGDDYDKLASAAPDDQKMSLYLNAIKGFGQSYAIKQNYADAYHNQANIFYKIGRLDLARATYEIALSYNPALSQTYTTLIQLDIMEKNSVELEKHLVKLQELDPTSLETAYIAAVAYAQIGMTDKAKVIVNELYKQFPNISEIKNLYEKLQ